MKNTVITAVACFKGGIGKTTTVLALGSILAAANKKVLLIDMDSQANTTKTYTSSPGEYTLFEAFTKARDRREYVLPVIPVDKNIDLAPASLDLAALDIILSTVMGREKVLGKMLQPVVGEYDYVLIDCPSALGLAVSNAIAVADNVLVPMVPDGYSASAFMDLYNMIQQAKEDLNPKLDILGIFLTCYVPNGGADKAVLTEILKVFPKLLLNTRVRSSAYFRSSTLAHKDIYSYRPNSIGALDYVELVKEIYKVKLPKH